MRKQVFGRNAGNTDWLATPETDLRFVYDVWNVVMVLNANAENATVRKYTWGLDMSGLGGSYTSAGIHAAGGIGGLLAAEEPQATGDPKRYWFFYDANGNVGQVLRYVAGSPPTVTRVAHYEYDPYGQALTVNNNVYATDGTLISTNTGYANDNPFRFSTKWLDTETALAYYGYRYYSPRLGRWLNRDPIGECGGSNLYPLVRNNPSGRVDALGFQEVVVPPAPIAPPAPGVWEEIACEAKAVGSGIARCCTYVMRGVGVVGGAVVVVLCTPQECGRGQELTPPWANPEPVPPPPPPRSCVWVPLGPWPTGSCFDVGCALSGGYCKVVDRGGPGNYHPTCVCSQAGGGN